MSLLTTVMHHSLDRGYAEAAARRDKLGRSGLPRTLRARLGLAACLVLVALVTTLGAVKAHEAAPTLARERGELIKRIDQATSDADDLQREVESLRSEVSAAQRKALRANGGKDTADLLALVAGAAPAVGPGIKVVIDDADGGQVGDAAAPRQDSGFSDSGRLRDRDLQRVVNGLWQTGAEAVAINGQRLTAWSAIRAAGDAILVDNKPLPPPYTVLAIGAGQRLSSAFQDSVDGRYLHVLQKDFGIHVSVQVQSSLHLPAAPGFTVRMAVPVGRSLSANKAANDAETSGARAKTGKGTS